MEEPFLMIYNLLLFCYCDVRIFQLRLKLPDVVPRSHVYSNCTIMRKVHRISILCAFRFINNFSSRNWTCRGGRVVKAFDSKSNGLCPHRFESCPRRLIFFSNFPKFFPNIETINDIFFRVRRYFRMEMLVLLYLLFQEYLK